jgi:hypothetical protein
LKVAHFVRFCISATSRGFGADDDASGLCHVFMIAGAKARQSAAEKFLLKNIDPAQGFKIADGIRRASVRPISWSR